MKLQLIMLALLVSCYEGHDQEFYYIKDPTEIFYVRAYGAEFNQNDEVITVESAAPVDILWNIDNSGSMYDNQVALANNFALFIEDFSQKNVDFKMAIITTDSSNNRDTDNSLTSQALSNDRDDFITDFKNEIRVGASGSANERSFMMTEGFLDGSTWLRDDASLVVISVSDEPEGSPETVANYKNAILASKGGDADKVSFFTICTRGHCSRFETMSQQVGGLVRYLDQSFANISTEFGDTIVRDLTNLQTTFELGDTPTDSTRLMVNINGSSVPRDTTETNGWNYDDATNSIKFFGSHIPPAGADIEISWRLEHNFCLKKPLDEEKLAMVTLSINDQLLEESDFENLWSYDGETNCIIFSGEIAPNSKVEITYTPDYTKITSLSSPLNRLVAIYRRTLNTMAHWLMDWGNEPFLAFVDN